MSEQKEKPLPEKPLPQKDVVSAPFWDSLRARALKVQRCEQCSKFSFPPVSHCPSCLSTRLAWTPVSGKGKVHAWATVEHAPMAAFKGDVPYNVSMVDLDEGVRVWTNVVGCKPSEVVCGLPVEAIYEDASGEFTLLKFRPLGR